MRPHEEKRRLIAEALAVARQASGLDEQASLGTDAEALARYEAVCPSATDLKVVAGALEIELRQRHGALVAAQGERRGRPSKEKVSQRDTFSQTEKQARKK